MSRAPMTVKGAQRLRAELEELKSVKRPAVINAIAEARAHGDLKENAEYHAAREMQGFIEGRIKELEGTLSNAQIIDVSKLNAGSRIVFGATVELAEVESGVEVTYQIVGDLEAELHRRLRDTLVGSNVIAGPEGLLERGEPLVFAARFGAHEVRRAERQRARCANRHGPLERPFPSLTHDILLFRMRGPC